MRGPLTFPITIYRTKNFRWENIAVSALKRGALTATFFKKIAVTVGLQRRAGGDVGQHGAPNSCAQGEMRAAAWRALFLRARGDEGSSWRAYIMRARES